MRRSDIIRIVENGQSNNDYIAIFVRGNKKPIWEIETCENVIFNETTFDIYNPDHDKRIIVSYMMVRSLASSPYSFFD